MNPVFLNETYFNKAKQKKKKERKFSLTETFVRHASQFVLLLLSHARRKEKQCEQWDKPLVKLRAIMN